MQALTCNCTAKPAYFTHDCFVSDPHRSVQESPPVQEKVCSGKDLLRKGLRLPSDERANLGGYVAPGIRLGDAFELEVSHVGLGGFQITKRNISNSTPVPRKIDTARFCCALTINTSRSIRQSIQASQRNLALADFA